MGKLQLQLDQKDAQHLQLNDETQQEIMPSNTTVLNGGETRDSMYEGVDNYTVPGKQVTNGNMNSTPGHADVSADNNEDLEEMAAIYDRNRRQKTKGNDDDDSGDSLFVDAGGVGVTSG